MQGKSIAWLGSAVLALGVTLTLDCGSASANGFQLPKSLKLPKTEVTESTGGVLRDPQVAPSLFGPWAGSSVYTLNLTTETLRRGIPIYEGKDAILRYAIWVIELLKDKDVWARTYDQDVTLTNYPVSITSTPMGNPYVNYQGQTVVQSLTTYDFGPLGKFVTQDELRIKQVPWAPAYYVVEGDKTLILGQGTGIFLFATGKLNIGTGMGMIRVLPDGTAVRDLREEGPFDWLDFSFSRP